VEVVSDKGSLGTYLVTSRDESQDTQESELETFEFGGRHWGMEMISIPIGNQLIVADLGSQGANNVRFPDSDFANDLKNPALPVTLKVKNYWPKCRLYHRPQSYSVMPALNRGRLADTFVTPGAPVTDSEHRDAPGVVVELVGPQGSLGTWLLWSLVNSPESFSVDGKSYELSFRFKRYYEPFRIGLVKFNHDKYAGTPIPKNFSSRLRVVNPSRNEDREVLIRMNEPLRYAGTTYYQGGFDEHDPHVSILQVVTNPGWLTPYLSCILVGVGLMVQFMMHLIGFITKRRAA
jgi:hypothetical protein